MLYMSTSSHTTHTSVCPHGYWDHKPYGPNHCGTCCHDDDQCDYGSCQNRAGWLIRTPHEGRRSCIDHCGAILASNFRVTGKAGEILPIVNGVVHDANGDPIAA